MKKYQTFTQPRYIVHWLMLVILFATALSAMDDFYMSKAYFYGDPIDAHAFKDWCFFDSSYVSAAKNGGYHHWRYLVSFLPLDLIFTLVYSSLLWSCIQLIKSRRWRYFLFTLIVAGALLDYGEDFLFSKYLFSENNRLAYWVAVFTTWKTIFILANGTIALTAFFFKMVNIVTSKDNIKKEHIQAALIVTGASLIPVIVFYAVVQSSVDDKIKILTVTAAAYFLVYKFMTGWLFINMNLKLTVQRENLDSSHDHLAIFVALSKGKIDSFWLKDIQCRISEVSGGSVKPYQVAIVRPFGIKKVLTFTNSGTQAIDADAPVYDYVLSPEEETTFSAYSQVKKGAVISIEAIIIGTRPFYGLESHKKKPIAWQTSLIVLPTKVSDDDTN